MPTPIILDCDPGHDDAIALLLALGSAELELLGVTTTYGNQTLEKTTANALRVLELAGRPDVPVASGAAEPLERELVVAAHVHGESGLDGPDPASTERRAGLDRRGRLDRRHRSTLVDAGDARADGAADEHRPLPRRHTAPPVIDRIVLMGGAIAEGNMTPAAEFNIWADPEAAQIVFDAEVDVTMIGLDVTHKAVTGPDVQRRLRDAGSVGVFVAELVDFFTVYHRETYGWDGAPIHDAVAVAHVLRPGLVETKRPQRRGGARVGALSWPHRRRPVAPHGPACERPRRRRSRHGRVLRPAGRADRPAGLGDERRPGVRRGAIGLAEQVRARRRDRPHRARPPALHLDVAIRPTTGSSRGRWGRTATRSTRSASSASRRFPVAGSRRASSASST